MVNAHGLVSGFHVMMRRGPELNWTCVKTTVSGALPLLSYRGWIRCHD
jgi:hypothetical protein